MFFATIPGWVMTRFILSLLFYLVFAPIGIILRMFGSNYLELKLDKNAETYWNPVEGKSEKDGHGCERQV